MYFFGFGNKEEEQRKLNEIHSENLKKIESIYQKKKKK